MSSPLAASHPNLASAGRFLDRVSGRAQRLVDAVPTSWGLSGVAVLGVLAAAGVAATAAKNPAASPPGTAVELRVAIIVALIGAGLDAGTSEIQARMGGLLIGAGFVSALWLLNGSSNRVLFSIGVAAAGVAPVLFAYLLLAHPTGRLSSRREAQFLWLTGGVLAAVWILGMLMTQQPPLKTPLLQCSPHCPPNVFALGSTSDAVGVVQAAMRVAWLLLSIGTPILLIRRVHLSPAPVRRATVPVAVVAALVPVLLAAYLAGEVAGAGSAATIGAIYIGLSAAVPVAILAGLGRERLFMGQTLAEFVSELARMPGSDPETLMAAALRDPSLRIAYRRPGLGSY